MEDKIRLYELVTQNGRSATPYVWRIRYSLAHKGLPFESVPLGFCDIQKQFGGRCKTVPVIEHGEWVGTVSTLPLLAKDDDALRSWLDRGFDLYGGIGRAPGMQPLFE